MRRAMPRSSIAPSGLGLDSAAVRLALVQRLRAEFHCHEAVCQAMREVPRHQFVDSALATQAYEDTSLPIGLGQTISKPSVVARMLEHPARGQPGARQRHARPRARDRHRLRLPDGPAGPDGAARDLDRAAEAAARQGARQPGRTARWAHPRWSMATAASATRRMRPTTASSPRPAAATCRRPGWSSWPTAAGWWRRWRAAPAAARCCWWSTGMATSSAARCTRRCTSCP